MSSVNPNNIDGTYPIAGQDNDSQGFRDNFTNIKNNFTFTASELTDLQNNAILKSALSGTTLNNNLNNAQLIGAQISKFTETRIDIGTQTGPLTINWSDAHFQTLTTSGSVNLTFANWPTSGFWTSFKLEINVANVAHTLTLPSSVSLNLNNIQGASGQTITFSTTGKYLFRFSTYDGGTTVTIEDLLRNYDSAIDFGQLNVTGNILSTGLTVFGNARVGLAGAGGGQFHTVVGNITQTSSGGAVYINTTGNILAAGGVLNDLTVNGNITTTGAQVETGYQQIKPTANVANVSISPTVNRVLLHPTGTVISFGANLTLPNTQVDGTIISISSNVTMASLAVITPWVGTSVSPAANVTSVAPGTVSRFMFINADKVWYKIA